MAKITLGKSRINVDKKKPIVKDENITNWKNIEQHC